MAVAFDAVGPSSAGTLFTASPGTWTHVNGGNGILVGVTTFTGTSNVVTGVTYGGTTIPLLGFVVSANDTVGGVALYGLVGPTCPTGSNTVSVAVSDANNHNAGSVSVSGAASLGTPVTNFSAGAAGGISASVTGTTSGGLVVSVVCQGSGNAFTATAPNVLRLSIQTTANSGSDNLAMGTDPSTGSTVAPAWTIVSSDFWGIVAVEVLPPAGGPSPTDKMMYGPGWHPGRGLPGMPGGTPFYSPVRSGTLTSTGATFSADTSLAVTAGITADAVAGGESTRQIIGQPGSRPKWTALLRNKQRRGRYFTVPFASNTFSADASLTVTDAITAAAANTASANSSLTVTAGITSALTETASANSALTVTAGITAVAARTVSADASLVVTAGLSAAETATFSTAASVTGTAAITASAALSPASAAASEAVTAGITAAATETASANTSLTVTAGITASMTLIQHADSSLAVTAGITANAVTTTSGAAALIVTAGINASETALARAAASVAITAGITAAANVGISANVNPAATVTAAASTTASAGASASVTAGLNSAASRISPLSTSVPVTASVQADGNITRSADASLTVTGSATAAASSAGGVTASVTATAIISADIERPSLFTVTLAIEWNVDVIQVPSSTLLSQNWKSMTNDTRMMSKDGVKYMSNDTRETAKDGVKYMTNGGYR